MPSLAILGRYRYLPPMTAFGATLLAPGGFLRAYDLLARLLCPPAGPLVAAVTALFGVPFFVYLLRKKQLMC